MIRIQDLCTARGPPFVNVGAVPTAAARTTRCAGSARLPPMEERREQKSYGRGAAPPFFSTLACDLKSFQHETRRAHVEAPVPEHELDRAPSAPRHHIRSHRPTTRARRTHQRLFTSAPSREPDTLSQHRGTAARTVARPRPLRLSPSAARAHVRLARSRSLAPRHRALRSRRRPPSPSRSCARCRRRCARAT